MLQEKMLDLYTFYRDLNHDKVRLMCCCSFITAYCIISGFYFKGK